MNWRDLIGINLQLILSLEKKLPKLAKSNQLDIQEMLENQRGKPIENFEELSFGKKTQTDYMGQDGHTAKGCQRIKKQFHRL